MWRRGVLLVSFALIALGSTTKCPKRKTSPVREILCYTSTFEAQLLADSVCGCTTLVHQNHDVRNLSISDIADLRKSLGEMHPPLQFVISIHDPEKTLRTSAMLRQEAIARIIAVMKEVDGVELNVTAGSKERLYNFVKSLKDEMIRKSYDKRIFVTLPSKSEDLAKQFDLKELAKYVDLFTLPTDYLTDEDSTFVTFHPSRLIGLFDILNTDSLVDLIIGLGAPKRKILVSLPANAYEFTLKDESENVPRSETTEKEPTPIDRKQLCEAITSGEWTVERDEDLTAPYAFRNKTWISFEDKISVGIKGKYAFLRDLAGLAVRNIENDVKTECERPITHEIHQSFTELKRKSRHAVLNALEDELHQAQFSYPNQAKSSNFRVVRAVDTEGHIRAVRENTQTEFICRRQGYFVHPKSCNRFYRCVKFNQEIEDYSVFEFDCPAGLSFDERTEVCVWPGSLPQGSPCPGSSEIAPVAGKRFECPSRSGYYADPQNCRWFFACMDLGGPELMAFEFRCPYGLVFDETKLVCEWPWLVPACSESGSAYTRTEYDYRGYTTGTSTGFGTGGYVTGSIPGYSVTTGPAYSGADYSKTTVAGAHGTSGPNYFGFTTGHAGGHQAGISTARVGTISGHAGSSGSSAIGYSGSTGPYGGSVPVSTYPGSLDIHVASVSPGVTVGGSTRYPATSSGIGSTGHTASGGAGYSGYTGGVAGYADTGSSGIATGISASTGGYSGDFGGGHSTRGGTTYSGTPESGYPGPTVYPTGVRPGSVGGSHPAAGVSYSQPGTGYFGSTQSLGSPIDIHIDSTGLKHDGSTGQYAESDAFNQPGSVVSATGKPYVPQIGVTYQGIGGSDAATRGSTSYSSGTLTGGLTSPSSPYKPGGGGRVTFNAPYDTGKYPEMHRVGGGSASSNAYSGATGRQPSSSTTGFSLYGSVPEFPYSGATSGGAEIAGSINGGYTGSTTEECQDSVGAEYSKVTDGISVGSVGIGVNLPSGSGVDSKPGYIPSDIPGRPGVTTAVTTGHSTRGGAQFSGATGTSSTGVRYDDEDGYTVPVFIRPAEPIYPLIGTTGARDHSRTTETYGSRVTSGYAQPGLARPHLNVSIFNDQISTDYVHAGTTGAIMSGASVEGSIITDDSLSGTILSHGSTSGAVSATASDQGAITTGGAHPGYIATSSGTPGYVVTDGERKIDVGSAGGGTIIYGIPSSGISSTGPSTPGVVLKGDLAPNVLVSGQPAFGVSLGGSIQPGSVVSATGRPYVPQTGVTYQGIGGSDSATRGSTSYSSGTLTGGLTSPSSPYKPGGGGRVTFNAPYDTGKYSESDLPDYRPTSATIPDSIVSGGKIESTGGVVLGSTVSGIRGPSTTAPGYSATRPSVFTPSGFTKTGPTKTGITTAVLSGGGSYSVSTNERRPILNPDNIGEKAFEGNVIDYTRTSSIGNIDRLFSTLTPPGYSSTPAPGGRVTLQSATPGYSYPKPTVKFVTGGASPAAPILPTDGNLPVTTPTPFLSVELHNGPPDRTSVFGSKLPTVSSGFPTPTVAPVGYTTKQPGTYQTTLFGAAKIPGAVSTGRPVFDTGYKTVIVPTNIPASVFTEDRFTQRIGGSQAGSISTPTGFGVPFQRTDTSPKDYSSFTSPSPVLGYLPGGPSEPGVTASTAKYDVPTVTGRPEFVGVTYKKPSPGFSGVTYKSPSSVVSPTTFRPTDTYYPGQGFSTPSSSGTTAGGGSPTNLDISRDEIDKLITNYRGTVKYTPSVYDSSASSGHDFTSTKKFSSSSSSTKTGGTFAIASGPTTSSYEVTTKPEGKGKVIVKWSDLHPLLLGKLGADCTCKADPFANLRGPGEKKLIASSRGKVDLANYDESDVYVDLEDGEEGDYVTNYGDFSPQPYKISGPLEVTSVATVSSNLPASSYLPSAMPPTISEPPAKNNALGEPNRFRGGLRVGKKLNDVAPSPNSITSEEDDPDQIIDGVIDCARPGLFRHPNLCNKFYACYWDQWKKKFTLHIFNCPVHLTFDSHAGACNWPSKGPACQADNLLV
ncbi:PREDICTED: mucin-19-like [Dinoponera quadriceps]|uniref:Mucin-19-like n=1 Tax=Dinoponera quadriceps TaxID=609295 RepID=A0A6P3XUE4_DINQU|nr:PREDICTED: mucin-19-like [Dinoponera quadriceps]